MTDLTLQEKKQLLLDAITTVDQITEEVKENVPFTDLDEQWEAKQYKSFLISKLGAVEFELQNNEENNEDNTEETNTTEEVEQVTPQEQDNKDEKDEKEEVKQ